MSIARKPQGRRLAGGVVAAALGLCAVAPAAGATRCGWLDNPTPGNFWLTDRDGEWILATQGSDGVPGMDEMPDMSTEGWVATNGSYGYGCACIDMTTDGGAVTAIARSRPIPLAKCRADPTLPDR